MCLVMPVAAFAQPDPFATFTYSDNMTPLGASLRMVPDTGPDSGSFNTDLAFWGDLAVHGSYAGFRLIDISDPANPTEIVNWEECASRGNTQGNQGDVIIWENLIIRSWNSPTPAGGSQCGDWPMAQGEEGLHVIDISDPLNPDVIAFVDTPTGSHTATLVPDLENNRLLVYNNSAPGGAFDMIQIPLDNPANASYLGPFSPGGGCHDWAVILGDVNLASCAGGSGTNVWSIGAPGGGTKDNPKLLYTKPTGGIGGGHSAAFTWDGEIIIIGHEPGGGSAARCQSGPPPRSEQEYSYFFLDARTGESLGQFAFPRPQTATENCTVHNYNVVPTNRDYVLVSGNYQAGISVVEFNDPANAREIAFADPAPLVHPTNPATGILLGGDWSTYWYNGNIYESDIRRGLLVWELDHPAVAYAQTLDYLNPQTSHITFETFPGARKTLGEIFDAGGITVGLEGKIRNALEKAQLWLTLPGKERVALSHLDRAIHLLLWQADVIENKNKPNQGDAAALRALAATLMELRADLDS